MWLLTNFLRSIPTWTLTIPSAIVNSLPPSLWFSLRGERENWKNNTFSAVEDSTLLQWHSGAQKHVGRAKERDQIDNEARLIWKSYVKTKHRSLVSLAFIWLVPGADRVARHICIRCMCCVNLFKIPINAKWDEKTLSLFYLPYITDCTSQLWFSHIQHERKLTYNWNLWIKYVLSSVTLEWDLFRPEKIKKQE